MVVEAEVVSPLSTLVRVRAPVANAEPRRSMYVCIQTVVFRFVAVSTPERAVHTSHAVAIWRDGPRGAPPRWSSTSSYEAPLAQVSDPPCCLLPYRLTASLTASLTLHLLPHRLAALLTALLIATNVHSLSQRSSMETAAAAMRFSAMLAEAKCPAGRGSIRPHL